jgi:hypothetical protein
VCRWPGSVRLMGGLVTAPAGGVSLGACIHPIDKMLSMRLQAASRFRRRGRVPAC